MRIFLVLICSFAFASLALGAQQEENKTTEEKAGTTAQRTAPPKGIRLALEQAPRKRQREPMRARRAKPQWTLIRAEGQEGQTSVEAHQGKGQEGSNLSGSL
jgi:hypothetical protein